MSGKVRITSCRYAGECVSFVHVCTYVCTYIRSYPAAIVIEYTHVVYNIGW